ncbi:hypothetical protein BH23ACT5_BH23ACT5_06950 [soil metagenome]
MTRVAVALGGEAFKRAAFSLAAHPGIAEVAVLAPATSKHFRVVEDPHGYDVVVGRWESPHDHGLPTVVPDEDLGTAGVYGGSILGLVLALAVGLDGVDTMAAALPGDSAGDTKIVFPSPIDGRSATVERFGGHPVHVARGEGPLGAAMVTSPSRDRVIVDNHAFLEGIALAAAASLLATEGRDTPTPVWTMAERYLRAAVDMGLVIGERLSTH